MNDTLHNAALSSDLLHVNGQPLALSLPVGAAVFVVQGEVWITQDGSADDIILAPGRRFDVKRRGLALVSATHGEAQLYVASPRDARTAGTLHDVLRARAERLRNAEFDQRFGALRRRVAAWWRRRRSAALTVPSACG